MENARLLGGGCQTQTIIDSANFGRTFSLIRGVTTAITVHAMLLESLYVRGTLAIQASPSMLPVRSSYRILHTSKSAGPLVGAVAASFHSRLLLLRKNSNVIILSNDVNLIWK